MARPIRIEYPGAWYHVMNRGACRQPIFNTVNHRHMFLNLLDEISLAYQIEIHAYCLMTNHYHLLVHTPKGNLSKAMKHLSSIYTLRYNKSQGADGPLFRGRFKSKLIEFEEYGLELTRYIHMNPVRAGIVTDPKHYIWSSYSAYIGYTKKPSWLLTDLFLDYFSSESGCQSFIKFSCEKDCEDLEQLIEGVRTSFIVGSEKFQNTVKSMRSYELLSNEVSERIYIRPTLTQIFKSVSRVYKIPEQLITRSHRGRSNEARMMAMFIAKKDYGYELAEIAKEMDLSNNRSVSTMVSRFIEHRMSNFDLESLHQLILSEIKLVIKTSSVHVEA